MRKTKIVCTLGPSTDREGVLREMIQAGMNVARFNFSHGTHAEHKMRLDALKALREELDAPVAAMLDTKGPEVRLKDFAGGRVHLTAGQEFTLTTVQVEGDAHRCSITYGELPGDVKAGDTILLDDGLVRLTVLETTETEIRCRVENDGDMKNHKGVNVPGVRLNMPYMSSRTGMTSSSAQSRASTMWRPALSVPRRMYGNCGTCWTRRVPGCGSSPRSKIRRASAIFQRSWTQRTASWWLAAIWVWRSTLRRSL